MVKTKKRKSVQTYPKCPLCNGEQTRFPPGDMFGPCQRCIDFRPEEVKEWRAKKEAEAAARTKSSNK